MGLFFHMENSRYDFCFDLANGNNREAWFSLESTSYSDDKQWSISHRVFVSVEPIFTRLFFLVLINIICFYKICDPFLYSIHVVRKIFH